jgi:hypothetical protein
MSPPEHRATETLIEAATTAWRARSPSGEIRAHPTWADLDVAGRFAAYESARRLRRLEAVRDPDGLSTTARAMLRALGVHERGRSRLIGYGRQSSLTKRHNAIEDPERQFNHLRCLEIAQPCAGSTAGSRRGQRSRRGGPLRLFVMGGGSGRRSGAGRLVHGGRWRDEHEWPLARTHFTDYYLHGDGSLTTDPPREASSATTYRFDPARPVPSIGGNVSSTALSQRPRAGELVYAGEPPHLTLSTQQERDVGHLTISRVPRYGGDTRSPPPSRLGGQDGMPALPAPDSL